MINKSSHRIRVEWYVCTPQRPESTKNNLYLEHVTKIVLTIVCNVIEQLCTVLWWGVSSWKSEDFFVKDFLQLTLSSLAVFLTWHHCIIILTFPKNIIFQHFHRAFPLIMELKMNVYRTYVRSICVLFSGGYEEASKIVL